MKKIILPLIVVTAFAFPAHATVMMPPNNCKLQETAAVSVQYNFKAKSFAEARKMFDDLNAKINTLAQEQKLIKFELQNQNYNIYSQPVSYMPDGTPDGFNYQVNGSSNYLLNSADAAFKFAEFLSSQKIQVGVNYNSYRNGNNCVPPALQENRD